MSSILACTLYLFKNRSLQEDRFFDIIFRVFVASFQDANVSLRPTSVTFQVYE